MHHLISTPRPDPGGLSQAVMRICRTNAFWGSVLGGIDERQTRPHGERGQWDLWN
jgi:hypothetical protein